MGRVADVIEVFLGVAVGAAFGHLPLMRVLMTGDAACVEAEISLLAKR